MTGRLSAAVGLMPAIELVPAAVDRDGPLFQPASAEVWRRWRAAAEQTEPSPEAIEAARQILAVQTLIYELWVCQEAGVAPAGLYDDHDAPARVHAVLHREAARRNSRADQEFSHDRDPGQFGAAAAHLACWAQLAIFGDEPTLIAEQTRAAGRMREELLRDRFAVCTQALAALRGPWSLPVFLADPVGKGYYRSQNPSAPHDSTGPEIPWAGRCARGDIRAIKVAFNAIIAAEMRRAADEFAAEQLAAKMINMPPDRLAAMHAEVQFGQQFLTAALAVRHATDQPGFQVDGRPVPPHLLRWVLDPHRSAAGRDQPHPTSTITATGLRIHFAIDGEHATTALVDAAGPVLRLAPDQVPALLDFLELPNIPTIVAKMRLTANAYGQALQATADPRGDPTRN